MDNFTLVWQPWNNTYIVFFCSIKISAHHRSSQLQNEGRSWWNQEKGNALLSETVVSLNTLPGFPRATGIYCELKHKSIQAVCACVRVCELIQARLLFAVLVCLNIKNETWHKLARIRLTTYDSLHAWFVFLLFYGCNYSCYLASHVPSKPDLLWTDFITDDPAGWLPTKMHLPPRNWLFCFAWIRTQKRTVA